MMHASPPEKRPRTDKSDTMFEYMCARIKLKEDQVEALVERIKNPPTDDDGSNFESESD